MTHRLHIDIETYSSVDLKRLGVYPYAASDDFQILMAAWSLDDSEVVVAEGSNIDEIPGLWDPEVIKVAHNAQFERVCFSAHRLQPGHYLPPSEWHDTAALAAEHGWPRSLDKLARALGGEQKDSAGTRLINRFCKPNKEGRRTLPHEYLDEWIDFVEYCRQDVVTLQSVDRYLESSGSWPSETEHQIFLADQQINDLGIAIDIDLARRGIRASELNQQEQSRRISELTGVDNPNSVPQMTAWLRSQGLKFPNLRADDGLQKLLSSDLTALQREVLELRQELALAASKKYSTAVGSVLADGRLHGTLNFYGAHTGRWSGRGTQVQNLPRLSFKPDADGQAELEMMKDVGLPTKEREIELTLQMQDATIADLRAGRRVSSPDLKRLVRPMFTGPLTVVDYSAIEARVIAWLAGEEWALEAFRAGRDIYVETAERMSTPTHPLDRSQGKVAVLALGFGGGSPSLRVMGAEGTEDELQYLKVQWRETNPRIVSLWYALEARLKMLHGAGDRTAARLPWTGLLTVDQIGKPPGRGVLSALGGRDHAYRLVLPSGRPLVYRRPSWKPGEKYEGRGDRIQDWRHVDLQFMDHHAQWSRTYGGRLAENVTQAVARDIMAEAIVRLHGEGYRVVGHVHDEILIEGEHDVATIAEIMCVLPSWATGLPVDAEGYNCDRYRKG